MATTLVSKSIEPRSPKGAYANEPFTDFKAAENAARMRDALESVARQLGREYDLVIGGERLKTAEKITSVNPARPTQVVGVHQKAGAEHAQPAMAAALRAFESWSRTSWDERVSLLLGAADAIRRRKFEFCAWLTYEVGKNWAEADADVGETIDFLEFYAREALRLAAAKTPIQYPGERNELLYVPLGVGAVIPPWNFPFAIMAGMTAASIVCGNTVILKPSSDAPTIAAKFVEVLEEAGMPAGVVNFCPGSGASFWERDRGASEDAVYCLYRIEGGGTGDSRARREDAAGADLDQADDSGDGRQGLDPGVRGRGSGRGRGRRGGLGLRLQRAEVFGVFAGNCGGAGVRRVCGAGAGAGGKADGGRPGGESQHGPGGECGGAEVDAAIRGDRARRKAG